MVCVPCFIVPVLLFLWHKFILPYVLRFWNPWAVKDAEGNVKTEFPLQCDGGVCIFKKKQEEKKDANEETNENALNETDPNPHTRLKAE